MHIRMMMMILLVQSEFVTGIMCYNSFNLQKELTKKKMLSFYLNYQSLSKKTALVTLQCQGRGRTGLTPNWHSL